MDGFTFVGDHGDFRIESPDNTSGLYFPLMNDAGMMSSVTPMGGGDAKGGQNTYLLSPVSIEDLHNKRDTRNFWCFFEHGARWSALGESAAQRAGLYGKEDVSLEAGLLWQKTTRENQGLGISSCVLHFVPDTPEQVELMQIRLTNTGNHSYSLTPVAAIPVYGRSADNIRDHRHVTTLLNRIEVQRFGIAMKPTLTFDERGHRGNETTYYVAGAAGEGEAPDGFYPLVRDFIGEGGSLDWPQGDMSAFSPAGDRMEGYEALGGIRFPKIKLDPGESKTYQVMLGINACPAEYLRETAAESLFHKTQKYWSKKIQSSFATGDSGFNRWMKWVGAQPVFRRICGCSFLPHHDYGKGGRGWRDLWQDCLALTLIEPDRVREMLLNHLKGVRADGSNATIIGTEPGEFLADRNSIVRVWMDHGYWPYVTISHYLGQTGDYGLLLEGCSYFQDGVGYRGERNNVCLDKDEWILKTETGNEYHGTVLEHLLVQHITSFYDVGAHANIRLRGADWNDGLDMAEEQGESVAFTAAYAGNLRNLSERIAALSDKLGVRQVTLFEELTELLRTGPIAWGDPERKRQALFQYCSCVSEKISGRVSEVSCKELGSILNAMSHSLSARIRETEWIEEEDGRGWFNSYYDNHGCRVEGIVGNTVRMMLTGQVFAIFSNTADDKQVQAICRAADRYLYNEALGGYRLNTNFHEVKTDLGRMFGFAYGHKENGAVFSHMAVMYANSLYSRGFVKEGWKVIRALYRQCMDFSTSRIYPGIPEYFDAEGRGMYHYLTGAASWLLLTVQTQMFGLTGVSGDLCLQPKLVREQFDDAGIAEMTAAFAGRTVCVRYENPGRKEYGNYRITGMTLDGVRLETNCQRVVIPRDELKIPRRDAASRIVVTLG